MGALEWASHCDLPAGVCAIRWLTRVVVASILVLGSPMAGAAAQLPRSVLILDQSGRDSVWFDAFFSGFRSTLNTKSAVRVSVYSEHLDLSRFGGARHDELLRRYLRDKFSETADRCRGCPRIISARVRASLAYGVMARGASDLCLGR